MALELRHTDKVAAVLLLGLSAVVWVVSRDFPSGFGETPGAAFFPRLIAASIAVLALALFARSLTEAERETHAVSTTAVGRFAVPVAFLVAYVALLPVLGFVLDTVLLLVALMWYSGVERFRVSLPLAVALGVALHYVFGEFLHIPLPEGTVVAVSRWLPSLPLLAGVP